VIWSLARDVVVRRLLAIVFMMTINLISPDISQRGNPEAFAHCP
jgi:hypothetical protein